VSKKNIISIISVLIIIAAALTELVMLTWLKNDFGPRLSSIIFFVSGLLTGIGFLIFFYKKPLYQAGGKINMTTRQLKQSIFTIIKNQMSFLKSALWSIAF